MDGNLMQPAKLLESLQGGFRMLERNRSTTRTSPASWDVDAFVDEVLVELAAMEGTKPTRSGPKPVLAGAALRKAIMAIWCLCFCSGGRSDSSRIFRSGLWSRCLPAGPGSGCGVACSTGCVELGLR